MSRSLVCECQLHLHAVVKSVDRHTRPKGDGQPDSRLLACGKCVHRAQKQRNRAQACGAGAAEQKEKQRIQMRRRRCRQHTKKELTSDEEDRVSEQQYSSGLSAEAKSVRRTAAPAELSAS